MTEFSDFIRHASEEEKAKVYGRVMRQVEIEQSRILKATPETGSKKMTENDHSVSDTPSSEFKNAARSMVSRLEADNSKLSNALVELWLNDHEPFDPPLDEFERQEVVRHLAFGEPLFLRIKVTNNCSHLRVLK